MAIGKVNVGGSTKKKFSKVTASIIAPSNPKEFDIWLECNDLIQKIYFSDVSVDLPNVGDVVIGTTALVEVLKSTIKAGNNTFKLTPKTPFSRNKKVFMSELVDVWADIGSAKVKRADDNTHYVNAFIYVNGGWLQFSVNSNVSFTMFWDDSSTASRVYKFGTFNNVDELTKVAGVRWSSNNDGANYGSAHNGILYDPIRRKIIVNGINSYRYEIAIDMEYDASKNSRYLYGFKNTPFAAANSRDWLIGLGGGSGTLQNSVEILDLETTTLISSQKLGNTGTYTGITNKRADYIEVNKVFVVMGHMNGYNHLNGIDLSKVKSGGVPELLFSIDYGNKSDQVTQWITVSKEGLITFYSPAIHRFVQVKANGEEVRRIDPTPLGLVTDSSPLQLNYLPHGTQDRHGNFYICSRYKTTSPGYVIMKLDKDFNKVWTTVLESYASDVCMTKEDILYVISDGKLLKLDCRSGDIISTVYKGLSNPTSNSAPYTTSSPRMASFPEFW